MIHVSVCGPDCRLDTELVAATENRPPGGYATISFWVSTDVGGATCCPGLITVHNLQKPSIVYDCEEDSLNRICSVFSCRITLLFLPVSQGRYAAPASLSVVQIIDCTAWNVRFNVMLSKLQHLAVVAVTANID